MPGSRISSYKNNASHLASSTHIYRCIYIYMNIYICMESHTHDVRTVYICLHLSTFVYTDS